MDTVHSLAGFLGNLLLDARQKSFPQEALLWLLVLCLESPALLPATHCATLPADL